MDYCGYCTAVDRLLLFVLMEGGGGVFRYLLAYIGTYTWNENISRAKLGGKTTEWGIVN